MMLAKTSGSSSPKSSSNVWKKESDEALVVIFICRKCSPILWDILLSSEERVLRKTDSGMSATALQGDARKIHDGEETVFTQNHWAFYSSMFKPSGMICYRIMLLSHSNLHDLKVYGIGTKRR